ncbi:MAG: cell division protein FtsQ/DivIB [Armatimonadota bacterium]
MNQYDSQGKRAGGKLPKLRDTYGPGHRGKERVLPKRPFNYEPYYRICLIALWIEILAALLTSKGMVIRHINISGNRLIQPTAIERSVTFHKGQNWLFWRPGIREKRLESFAQVKNATIKRSWIGIITVKIEERKAIGVLVAPVITPQGKKYQTYMLASDGVLYNRLAKPVKLPRVELRGPTELYLGMNVFDGISIKRTDIKNPATVYELLTDKELRKGDLRRKIAAHLSKKTHYLFDPVTGDPNSLDARISLTDDLNSIISKGEITAGGISSRVELPPEIRNDVDLKPEGKELADVNRKLLEFLLPSQIVTSRIPGDSLQVAVKTLTEVLPKYKFRVKSVVVDPFGFLCFNMESGVVVKLGDENDMKSKLLMLDKALCSREGNAAIKIDVSAVTDEAVKSGSSGYFTTPRTEPNVPKQEQ